jgi:hypothetical protein
MAQIHIFGGGRASATALHGIQQLPTSAIHLYPAAAVGIRYFYPTTQTIISIAGDAAGAFEAAGLLRLQEH